MIGAGINRLEGPDKATGQARYSAEAAMPDAAFGVVVQSTIAKGKIRELDISAAHAAPGVVAILTHENMPMLTEGFSGDTRAPLSDLRVIYAGQHLAVVVADTPERAKYAASLIRVSYDGEPPIVERDDPRVVTTSKSSDGDEAPSVHRGNVDAALRQEGLAIVRETYTTPIETHNPMEMSATTAFWDGDQLTVWDSTQGVSRTRDQIAKAFGLDPEKVRVVCKHTGGGFGGKGEQWHHKFLAIAAAKLAARPVRLMLSRQQMFTSSGHRPATEQDMTVAATSDGKLVALRHATIADSSPTNTHIESCGSGTSRFNYATPNLDVTHKLRVLDLAPPTWMRAPGEAPGSFALECVLDELAEKLGIDPIEMRVRNHAAVNPDNGKPWSTNNLLECYRLGAERFGWNRKRPEMRDERGRRTGFGMATASYPAYKGGGTTRIRLFIGEDGIMMADAAAASQDLGTGTWTIGAQILAEATGLPIDRVRFEIGDSDLPRSGLSGGSTTAAGLSQTISDAAKALKAALLNLAGDTRLVGLKAHEVVLRDGKLMAKNDVDRWAPLDLLVSRHPAGFIEATNPNPPDTEDDEDYEANKEKYAFHSFGAHFIEVAVDDLVPRVEVKRIVSCIDIGKVLNSKTARNQVVGGVVMGIGMALLEETLYDPRTGRPMTDNFADYAICVNADVPDIDVQFVGEPDYRFNPMGARGVGEIGITGVAAAIANAVYHATGKRIRDLPITLDKLL
jgi:xanthine dehydrogenase YagR molybdenum-binding subunit